jgi:hypothetical protein
MKCRDVETKTGIKKNRKQMANMNKKTNRNKNQIGLKKGIKRK